MNLTPDQRLLLAHVVGWDGYLETAELCDEAGLSPADVSRRDLPRLRELGLVAPSLYRPTARAERFHGSGMAEHIARALSKWGPMTRGQIAERAGWLAFVDSCGCPPVGDHWKRPSKRSGAFKRALSAVVEAGAAVPAAVPVPTDAGRLFVADDDDLNAIADEVRETLRGWRESARRVGSVGGVRGAA